MNRDILYAKEVQRQCSEIGYCSVVNSGTVSIESLTVLIEEHFGLEKSYEIVILLYFSPIFV